MWPCGRSSPVLVVWGGSPASGWLMFSNFPAKEKSLSALLSCQAANLGSCSCACWHVSYVKYPLVRHVPLSSSSSPWLVRDLHNWCVWRVRTLLVVHYARELGVRGARFRCLLRWRVLVTLIKETGVFCAASPATPPPTPATDARRHRRPPLMPAADARHRRPREATTRAGTRGRYPRSFPNSPQNTHGKPRSFLRQNVAVRLFGALPVAYVVLRLGGSGLLGRGGALKSASMLLLLLGGPGAAKKRPKVQNERQIVLALMRRRRRGRWFGRDDVTTNKSGTTP